MLSNNFVNSHYNSLVLQSGEWRKTAVSWNSIGCSKTTKKLCFHQMELAPDQENLLLVPYVNSRRLCSTCHRCHYYNAKKVTFHFKKFYFSLKNTFKSNFHSFKMFSHTTRIFWHQVRSIRVLPKLLRSTNRNCAEINLIKSYCACLANWLFSTCTTNSPHGQ